MTGRGPDWMDLNAFVDGELTRERGEAVARAAAADPGLAAQIDALRRLKAAAAQSVEVLPTDLPPGLPPGLPPDLPGATAPPRRPWLRRLQAACLVFLLFGAGALTALLWRGEASQDWTARGWALHETWIGAGGPASASAAGTLLIGLQTLGPDAQAPQLEAAKLRLDYVALVLAEGRDVLHLGYRGTRGCRLSLFVFEAGADWIDEADLSQGARRGFAWQVGGLGYLLLARDMEAGRFGLIADKMAQATRAHRNFDAETRTALQRSRAASPPCSA